MATATTLAEAAGQAFDNLLAKWVAGTLKTDLTTFVNTALPLFLEQEVASHPVSNWCVLVAAIANEMTAGNSFNVVPYVDNVTAAGYVYRLCWMAQQLLTQNTISSTQGTALLAAYNANF